jgi:hypothetical protein
MFVDGFNVAKQIHENHPDAFDVLKNFHVRYVDVGIDAHGEYASGCSHPIIKYVSSFHNFHANLFPSIHKMEIQIEKGAYTYFLIP